MADAETFETASCEIESLFGRATMHVFSFGPHEEDNILCLHVPTQQSPESPLLRVQSACYTAEIFRSLDCECHEQLVGSLEAIHRSGGYLVYMLCDGRGAGLLTKIRGLKLGETDGLDTWDAYQRLGSEPDPRDYSRVIQVLRHFDLRSVRLLTNNPRKLAALETAGISVERVALEYPASDHSRNYLRAKRDKFGHLLGALEG